MKTAKEVINLIKKIAESYGCETNVSYMPALNIKNIICRVFIVCKDKCIYFNVIDDHEFGVMVDASNGEFADERKINIWIGEMNND